VRVGSSIGDITAGLFLTVGILAALEHRHRTGEGTFVDVGMLDAQVAILENAIARYQATGDVPGPLGTRHPSITPFAAFAAADGRLVIAAGNDQLFRRLGEVIGRPALADDPRFATNAARSEHAAELAAVLETALARAPVADWLERLQAAGIPCGPVNDIAAVMADPQVAARNMIVAIDDPRLSGFRVAGNPIKITGYDDPPTRGAVPDLPGAAP
jgi:CoA:oxalate CoA-transferase